MLSLPAPGARLCDGWTRREWLRVGGLGAFGLSLTDWLARAAEAGTDGRARKPKACILLSFLGAPSQQETWDPKPDAPAEVRGDLRPIPSATPGLWVGELMPRTARLTGHLAVLRAMQTNDNAHSSSGYYMATGRPHLPVGVENAKPGPPNDWPALGAIVRSLWPGRPALPPAITLPEQSANDGNLTWPGQDAGFLGRAADPWLLHCEPEASGFQIPGLGLPADVPAGRFAGRMRLRDAVNRRLDEVHRTGVLDDHESRTRQAFDLISSPRARRAFALDREPARLRERYGNNRFGQGVLLARRLVEAGVPLIRVNWTRVKGAVNNGHWDTHRKNTLGLKQLMPIMDRTYSALLEDLSARGLLDDTLVVWMGEFGRTPRINKNAGRDHWGQVFSVALAGGGVRGGAVYGASDRIAAYPREGRVAPEDLTATVLHCLGLAPNAEIHDRQGRPFPASRGRVIRELF
jgi:hypothetical protein